MLIVSDNLQIIRKPISDAVAKGDPEPIRSLVRRCEAAGAQAIDINSGPLGRRPQKAMAFLVRTVEEATDLPLVLDSANPSAMAAGLEAATRPAIINGFSLEPVKMEQILPLAARHQADIIGYLLDCRGQVPMGAEARMSVAVELFHAYTSAGLDPQRLIVDPVVVPVTWQEGHRQAVAVIQVIARISDLLGTPVRTIAGLSNLTTGVGDANKRSILEQCFIPMLAAAGLDLLLMNVLNPGSVRVARASRLLTADIPFAWEGL